MSILDEIIQSSNPIPVPGQILKLPFGDGFWPWMRVARKRIQKRAGKELKLLFPEAVLSIEESLIKRWEQIAAPSFALEMSISRLHGELDGETLNDRYCSFMQKMFWNHDRLRDFFSEYKTLAHLVCRFLELWEEQTVEFLQRLAEDLPLLATTFNSGEPLGKVATLSQNAGDFHHGGRSVYYLKFESGKELFYKPKNLSFSVAFHSLLKQLNELGAPLDLKGYIILPRDKYGWEEKVHHLPCKNLDEVTRYFERAGMLLCLFYLFDGTDVHCENIIASGEYPILIDQETFFHSVLTSPDKEEAIDAFNHSVLKTGFLPNFINKNHFRGPDISGLSGERDFISILKWKNTQTDEMEKSEEKIFESYLQHRVIFKNIPQNAHEHIEEIIIGFRRMYTFIQNHRNIFIKKDGWLEFFAQFPVRIIIRATHCYAYLLERFYHPSILLHEEEQKKEFEILNVIISDPDLKHLVSLIKEEKRAILQGDIPFFYTFSKEKHLYAGHHFVLENCLDGCAYTRALKRIEGMNEEECEKQEMFIRKSFYARQVKFHEQKEHAKTFDLQPLNDFDKKNLLIEVRHIADMILDHAYRSRNESLGWIHLEPNPYFDKFELQPMSEHLYGGKIGIALFFSALYALSNEEKWKDEALNTLKSMRIQIKKGNSKRLIRAEGIGGMSGVGSMIYGLTKAGHLLHELSLLEEATILALCIEEENLEQDKKYDIIEGSAGLILALLALWEATHEKRIMDLAVRTGEYLCIKAEKTEYDGLGWKNLNGFFLLGFSHGVAGIAYALLKLAAVTARTKFSDVAQAALAYERALFCPVKKNWPYLGSHRASNFLIQWCHGAVGVGFGRLASLPYLNDEHLIAEITIAITQTKEHLFSNRSLSLCCGLCGKLEFLKSTIPLFPDSEQHLESIVFSLLTHHRNQPKEHVNLSFMQGIAGIGYTLLRTVDKENLLPQVLLMQ